MRRLLLPLLAATAAAGPEVKPESYDSAMKRLGREQRKYENRQLSNELGAALNMLTANWTSMTGRPETPNVYYYDLSGYKEVFDTWADFERRKGKLAEMLAGEGGPAAAKRILDQLRKTIKDIAAEEKIIPNAKPISWGMIQDQEPAVRRYGAYQRLDALVVALGKLRDAEGIAYVCKRGWADACKWDGRDRVLARVAVLDALALTGDDAAFALLEEAAKDERPEIRIAAIEGIARMSKADVIAPRLAGIATSDPCYAVRAAALDLLAADARDAAAAPVLVDALGADRHAAELARVHHALAAIAGTDLGRDPAPWRAWIEAKAQGKEYKPDEERTTTAEPGTGAGPAFDQPILVVECTYIEFVPADLELAAKRNWFDWYGVGRDQRTFETQWDVQRREAKELVNGLGEEREFSLLVMQGLCEIVPFNKRGPVQAKKKTKGKAAEFLDEIRSGISFTNGREGRRIWMAAGCSPCQGLWAAYEAIGLDPWEPKIPDEADADAILYSGDGCPNVGPIIHIEATIDDIRRLDRFFRIPVHCVRVGNTEGAGETLEGIAKATGGSYRWIRKP